MKTWIIKIVKNKKLINAIAIPFGFASFFMVALTFNFIGNNVISTNLILGFTLGLIASIGLAATAIWIRYFKGKWIHQILFLAIGLISLFVIITVLALTFGTIGYLGAA